jgi:hypothetical protein
MSVRTTWRTSLRWCAINRRQRGPVEIDMTLEVIAGGFREPPAAADAKSRIAEPAARRGVSC